MNQLLSQHIFLIEAVKIIQFTAKRLFWLFFTVVMGTYLAILIANGGGKMDVVRKTQCLEESMLRCSNDAIHNHRTPEERQLCTDAQVAQCHVRLGLDQPFIERSFYHLLTALTLDLGRAEKLHSDSGSKQVRNILIERLPSTLLLSGTASLLLFFISIQAALYLSRHYDSFLDKTVVALAPTSIAPAWLYGIFLLLIFAGQFSILPWGGMVDNPPPLGWLAYSISIATHLLLPIAAIISASIFFSIYAWRTFFLIYSSEDYVEMAKAKGLPNSLIQQRYILRPALPPIITDFSFMLISLWEGSMVLETVFNWPGLGRLLFQAIGNVDIPVIIGTVVIYGYLLAFTTFFLDIVYAMVDPRVRISLDQLDAN
jgi:peptide/nickel transport system permease protein